MELSDVETAVFILIKEYLKKNRVFNVKNIIPWIVQSLSSYNLDPPLNEAGVEKILWHFIRERIVIPGSKLTKEKLLENYSRKSIYNHVFKNPGTHLREIMNKLELGAHATLWHINLLIKFGYVRFTAIGKYKTFFVSSLPDTLDKEIFYLGNATINEIIQLMVVNGEGLTINRISEELGIHYNTANKSMHILNELGLLLQTEDENQVNYILNRDKFSEIISGIDTLRTSQ